MFGTSDKFWERFNGDLSFGTIYTKGNQSTQYTLGSQLAYVRERWSAGAGYDSSLSTSSGTSASTRNSLNLSGLHLLPWNNWFYSGVGDFLQSSVQGISLQTTVGGGIGRYLKNTNRASVTVLGGGAWQNTSYRQSTSPVSGQNLATALIYSEAKLFRFSKTNLTATAMLLPALSEPGRVRFSSNASYYVKLFSNLKWNVSFYGNWDNRPPQGFASSDLRNQLRAELELWTEMTAGGSGLRRRAVGRKVGRECGASDSLLPGEVMKQELAGAVGVEGAREEIALRKVAAEFTEAVDLELGFDTFSDGVEI